MSSQLRDDERGRCLPNSRQPGCQTDDELWDDDLLKFSIQQYLYKKWYIVKGISCQEVLVHLDYENEKRVLKIMDELVTETVCERTRGGENPLFKLVNVSHEILSRELIGIGRGRSPYASIEGLVPMALIHRNVRTDEPER